MMWFLEEVQECGKDSEGITTAAVHSIRGSSLLLNF